MFYFILRRRSPRGGRRLRSRPPLGCCVGRTRFTQEVGDARRRIILRAEAPPHFCFIHVLRSPRRHTREDGGVATAALCTRLFCHCGDGGVYLGVGPPAHALVGTRNSPATKADEQEEGRTARESGTIAEGWAGEARCDRPQALEAKCQRKSD